MAGYASIEVNLITCDSRLELYDVGRMTSTKFRCIQFVLYSLEIWKLGKQLVLNIMIVAIGTENIYVFKA